MGNCNSLKRKKQVKINGEWVDTRSYIYLQYGGTPCVIITGGHQGDEIQIGFVALKDANELMDVYEPYDYVKTITLDSSGSAYLEVGSDDCITMINPISPERFGSSTHIIINNCNIKCLVTPFVDYQPHKNIGEGILSINNSRCPVIRDYVRGFPLISANSFSSITFNNFDTSEVESLHSMFVECKGVTSLNLSGWDTRLVDNIDCVFVECDKLQSIDLSWWDFSNVKYHYDDTMFCLSNSLKTVYARGCNQATIDEFKKGFSGATIVTE